MTRNNINSKKYLLIAKNIVALLSNVKRSSCENNHQYIECVRHQLIKLERLILEDKKITFILPAFPAKSPNNNKTFGILPDKGEYLALHLLNRLCNSIKQFYLHGAEIVICSDGRVFNDLVKVADVNVDAYSNALRNIISDNLLTNIKLFGLDDYYEHTSFEKKRLLLIEEFSESVEATKSKIKNDPQAQQQFNGIHRFIFEDNVSTFSFISRNKIRSISKNIAYQVIQRSNAWSALLKTAFPAAIRLSIHPQMCGSDKIGVMLLKSSDKWATPWHRVVIYDGRNYSLIKKANAEQLGATPIFIRDQFSHYVN